MLLLAELTAPLLQPGPVRLPALPPLERPSARPEPPIPRPPLSQPALPVAEAPVVRGFQPYAKDVLAQILAPCRAVADAEQRLRSCGDLLVTRLFSDGYISTRVLPRRQPAPGVLEVEPGRIERIDVISPSPALQRRVNRLLQPLRGEVLHLPSLSESLNQLQRRQGVGRLRSSLNRVARDSSRAVLLVTVDPDKRPLRGEISLRNDGNSGSGQFRGVATLIKPDVALAGDSLVVFGELNSDSEPEFGYRSLALSYSLPLAETFSFTAAAGINTRQLVEAVPPIHDLSFDQLQLYGQFDLTIKESLTQRFYAFAGLSVNRNEAFLAGDRVGVLPGGGEDGWLRSGYARVGLGLELTQPTYSFDGSLYLLQGIAGLTPHPQREELRFLGVDLSQARAIGSQASLSWLPSPRWSLQLRIAGQVAFQPLPNSMGFSLGSDTGLRGLPGQLISGDSGVLGSLELAWLLWSGKQQSLQLVPFLGAGNVWTDVANASYSDSIGAGGLLLRWISGSHSLVELGWVHQFPTVTRPYWDQWILGSGVYTKLTYRF